MAQRLVTGIYSESDPKALESALTAQNVDLNRLRVVTRNAQSSGHALSTIDFVDVVTAMDYNSFSDDMTHGMGILGDSGGTGVPGLTSSAASMVGARGPANYLAAFPIPPDQIDNYNDAIASGRSVVTCLATDDEVAGLQEAFRAAGLRNVKAF